MLELFQFPCLNCLTIAVNLSPYRDHRLKLQLTLEIEYLV